jgi:ribonuclease D
LTDEENEIVEQAQEATQGADRATESENQHDERQLSPEVKAPPRKGADYNWSEARRKMAELERRSQEQQETINRLQAQKAPEEELSPDDLLTVAQLQKVNAKRDQETIRELQKHKEEIVRLRYPDLDQVLSNENLELFEQQEPELAETLTALQGDPIKMRVAAYKMIKKTLHKDTPPSSEKNKAESNSKKPVSVQSVGKGSAIGTISAFENGLTPELKKQLYKEMQDAIKRT